MNNTTDFINYASGYVITDVTLLTVVISVVAVVCGLALWFNNVNSKGEK